MSVVAGVDLEITHPINAHGTLVCEALWAYQEGDTTHSSASSGLISRNVQL